MSKFINIETKNFDLAASQDEVFTLLLNTSELTLNLDIKDADVRILIFNNAKKLILNEKGILQNAHVSIIFLELSNTDLIQNTQYLLKNHSSLDISTSYLGTATKTIDYEIIHDATDTKSNILNNVVSLQDARFAMKVIGRINKGAKGAACHQKNNCLTIEKPQSAKIEPILIIDENEVEASHSLACGTLDSEIMFYMNSRGLSAKDALHLLLQSYLLKDEDTFNGYANSAAIIELSRKKVAQYVA